MTGSFARHTGLVAVGQAAVKATQLALAIVLVRLLSPAEWNETALLLSIYLAAVTVGTFNLQHGLLFYLPRVGERFRRALVMQNVGVLGVVGVMIAVALTIAAPALLGDRLGDASRLPLLGIAVALELPAACTATTLIATAHFAGAALWDLAGTALVIGLTVLPVALGAGVDGVVVGLAVAGGVRLLGSFVVIGRTLPGPLVGLGAACLASQLVYAVPLGLALGVSILNRAVDKWFIAAFASGDFGVYAIAAQELPLLAVLPYAGGAALITALVDAFHEGDVALARTHWIGLTMTMSAFVVPLGMALILIAPELLATLFTSEFAAGVVPFQLFTLVTLHRVAEYGMLLRAAGRTRDLVRVATVTLIANALLAGFGAYHWGMIGASLGTVFASGIGWAAALASIASVLQVPIRDAFAWRAWLTCVVIASVAAGLAEVTVGAFDLDAGTRIAGKLISFTAVYLVGLRVLRRSGYATPPASSPCPAGPTVHAAVVT